MTGLSIKTTTFFLFTAMLFLACPVTAHTAENRGIVPVPILDKSGRQVGLYKESHALVIGVSEYVGGWPRLPGVVDDLREVTRVLEDRGFNVVVVRNPDREGLEKAFNDFINKYGLGKDNRLLFYFAGHGHTLKPAYGGDMGYIVPIDAPDPNRDEAGFLAKALSMNQMDVYARNIQSKHALFLFDSCFSGALFALSRAIPEVIQEKTSRPVRQFITAGTSEQTVPDRSIFRAQFVSALQGEADMDKDGYVTASELGQFLETTVTNYSHRSQTPKYGKIADPNLDKGDFVFPLGGTVAPRKSVDLEQERQRLEAEKRQLAEDKQTLEEEKRLAGERRQLDEEKKRLSAEREKLARLEPPKAEPKASSGPAGMVKIPGGTFYAGLQGERDNPVRELEVGTFSIDKYEVTQSEYERVMGSNPSYFKGGNLPVESVTWHKAGEYCQKVGKRLPTEWEWEKAAKGGTRTTYHWGNNEGDADRYAWFDGNSGYEMHPVGQKEPNQYGLYDMAGNVWEWTASDYDKSGEYKVLRGGSWSSYPSNTRPANRISGGPGSRFLHVGFRCVQ